MTDIRLIQQCKLLESEAKKIGDKLFLNRNEAWGRDYGSSNDNRVEVKTDRTLDGYSKANRGNI